jgi:hypothetical protein
MRDLIVAVGPSRVQRYLTVLSQRLQKYAARGFDVQATYHGVPVVLDHELLQNGALLPR